MRVKAFYDGKKIILPRGFSHKPGDVLVIMEENDELYLKASEKRLTEVWDNDEDAVYDSL